MKWYKRPIAAVGSVVIAYHEVIRGRQTGVCSDCGRLEHATSEYCLCGGEVSENEHAAETLDDPSAGVEDSLDRPVYLAAIVVLRLAVLTSLGLMLAYAIGSDGYSAGLVGFLSGALAMAVLR
jgi:hypothetical protein